MSSFAESLWLAAPALMALPLYLVIHVLLWQVLPQERKGVLFLVLTAACAYFATVALWPERLILHVFTSLPLYAFEVVLYMHLYFGIDRSLSVRMLGELVRSGKGSLTLAELNRRYEARDMVERRVEVLLRKGILEKKGDTHVCTARGRMLVRLALLGKSLYGLQATG